MESGETAEDLSGSMPNFLEINQNSRSAELLHGPDSHDTAIPAEIEVPGAPSGQERVSTLFSEEPSRPRTPEAALIPLPVSRTNSPGLQLGADQKTQEQDVATFPSPVLQELTSPVAGHETSVPRLLTTVDQASPQEQQQVFCDYAVVDPVGHDPDSMEPSLDTGIEESATEVTEEPENYTFFSQDEGPGLRTLGIPLEDRECSIDSEKRQTPTQDSTHCHAQSPFPHLDEVLDITRRSRDEAERCYTTRQALFNRMHNFSYRKRLVNIFNHRYKQLVRCHREDYASDFAVLYAEIPDLTRQDSPTSGSVGQRSDSQAGAGPGSGSSWLSQLSNVSQDVIVDLVNSIRSDNTYLAARIAGLPLSHMDMLSRLQGKHSSEVPGFSRHGAFRPGSRPPSRLSHLTDTFDTIDEIQRDPLQVMINTLFACTDDFESPEALLRERVWSSVCAKLINEQSPGSDRLLSAIFNEFAQMQPWKLAAQLENLLQQWIQAGVFIFDPDSVPNHRNEPEEIRKSRFAVESSRFFEKAMEQILQLLVDSPDTMAPLPVLNLVRTTLGLVDDLQRHRAEQLLITTWFCNGYLRNALLTPETHGILSRQHIRKEVRTKLLNGVCTKLTGAFESRQSHHLAGGNLIVTNAGENLHSIFGILTKPRHPVVLHERSSDVQCLSLDSAEILTLLVTLFPKLDKLADMTGRSVSGTLFSTGSSLNDGSKGSTTGSHTPMFGTTSSTAPSTSSTSITSDTFFAENQAGNFSASSDKTVQLPLTPDAHGDDQNSKIFMVAHDLRALIDVTEAQLKPSRQKTYHNTCASILRINDGVAALEEDVQDLLGQSPDGARTPSATAVLEEVIRNVLTDIAESQMTLQPYAGDVSSPFVAIGRYLTEKVHQAQDMYEYSTAFHLSQYLQIYEDATLEDKQTILHRLVRDADQEVADLRGKSALYQTRSQSLASDIDKVELRLTEIDSACKILRDKQWYASTVCHSTEYRDSLNITQALATMATGKASRKGGLAGWAKRKLKASFGSEKAQSNALALLSANKQHGGPGKLTDSEAEQTADWLTNNSIENFCAGEERIHRFCLEVQKCVQKLVADTFLGSPVLWASNLYDKEKAESGGLWGQRPSNSLHGSPVNRHGSNVQQSLLHGTTSRMAPFSISPPPSRQANKARNFTSLQPQASRPSILDPSIAFSSLPRNALGLTPPWMLPASPESPIAASPPVLIQSPRQLTFLEDLRKTVISLLLSDLGLSLWNNGSETDRWVNEERLQHESITVKIASPSHPNLTQLTRSPQVGTADPGIGLFRWEQDDYVNSQEQLDQNRVLTDNRGQRFSYETAYSKLLSRFQVSPDPLQKLTALYELVRVIGLAPQITDDHSFGSSGLASQLHAQFSVGMPDRSIPRTGLTKLQEATLNCEERRLQSLTLIKPAKRLSKQHVNSLSHRALTNKTDKEVWLGDPKISNTIQALLLDRSFYPDSLFRDLQLISAFVPSSFLDSSPQGAAFWTVGLAAMQLKSVLCADMIDRAAQITDYHVDRGSNAREPVRHDPLHGLNTQVSVEPALSDSPNLYSQTASPRVGCQGRKVDDNELRNTTLTDAGRLFRSAALEGDPSAARELGLFYLTHPEHVRRTLRPLSKPSDVARMASGVSSSTERLNASASILTATQQDLHARKRSTEAIFDSADGMILDEIDANVDGRDPSNLATAWHWMEFAADGGDQQAKTFLTNNTELRWDAQGRRI